MNDVIVVIISKYIEELFSTQHGFTRRSYQRVYEDIDILRSFEVYCDVIPEKKRDLTIKPLLDVINAVTCEREKFVSFAAMNLLSSFGSEHFLIVGKCILGLRDET